jgi:hypothetical protein
MNNFAIGILSIFIALAILCLQAIIEHTPPIYVFGAIVALFCLGFIFGENQSHD